MEWILTSADRHRQKQMIHAPAVPSWGMNGEESMLRRMFLPIKGVANVNPFFSICTNVLPKGLEPPQFLTLVL